MQSKKPYYRYIYDGSKDNWTERTVPNILQYLRDNDVSFNIVWQGYLIDKMSWLIYFNKSPFSNLIPPV